MNAIPLELRWLIYLLRVRLGTATDSAPDAPVTAEALIAAARFHRVIPLIIHTLEDGIPESLDPELLPALQRIKAQNQRRTLQRFTHLIKVQRQLETLNIPFLCLKGIALSQYLHGTIDTRMPGDIDLWINEKHVDRLHTYLLENGYQAKTGYGKLSPGLRQKYREHMFHIGYTHVATDISLEIHWRLTQIPELMPLSFEQALMESLPVSIQQVQLPCLSPQQHLAFLYIHGARHVWERLGWLCDIAFFHQKHPEISVSALSSQTSPRALASGRLLLEQSLSALHHSESLSGTTPQLNRLARKHLYSPIQPDKKIPGATAFCYDFLLCPDRQSRTQLFRTHLLGPDDWQQLPLPASLTWIYLLLRPLFWMKRKLNCTNISS